MATRQIVNSTVQGPIYSNGGEIDVTAAGVVNGGPTGVYAQNYNITLSSNHGSISASAGSQGGFFGVGVLNLKSIGILSNFGEISGAQFPFQARRAGMR